MSFIAAADPAVFEAPVREFRLEARLDFLIGVGAFLGLFRHDAKPFRYRRPIAKRPRLPQSIPLIRSEKPTKAFSGEVGTGSP